MRAMSFSWDWVVLLAGFTLDERAPDLYMNMAQGRNTGHALAAVYSVPSSNRSDESRRSSVSVAHAGWWRRRRELLSRASSINGSSAIRKKRFLVHTDPDLDPETALVACTA